MLHCVLNLEKQIQQKDRKPINDIYRCLSIALLLKGCHKQIQFDILSFINEHREQYDYYHFLLLITLNNTTTNIDLMILDMLWIMRMGTFLIGIKSIK